MKEVYIKDGPFIKTNNNIQKITIRPKVPFCDLGPIHLGIPFHYPTLFTRFS